MIKVQKTFQKMKKNVGIQDTKNYTNKGKDQTVEWMQQCNEYDSVTNTMAYWIQHDNLSLHKLLHLIDRRQLM